MTNPLPHFPIPHLPDLADLSRASGSWLATLGVGLAVGLPISGAADPIEPRARATSYRWLDDKGRPPTWLGENVHYRKGVGLEYRHAMKVGAKPMELGFQGPIVRKKKSVGLTVELRF